MLSIRIDDAGHRQILAATVIVLLIWTPAAQAQGESPAPLESAPEKKGVFASCRQNVDPNEVLLDEASRRVQETVCGAALWFDGLFGEKGDVVAARQTYGRVEVATDYSEFYGTKTRVRFHARVQLPQLERRLSAFIGRDDEDDFVRDRSEGQALRSRNRSPTDRDEFLAGLGFAAYTSENVQSDFKVGVRNVRLPKVFVQNRLTFMLYSEADQRAYLRTTPFWTNRDGFGLTQGFVWDWVLAQDFLLRADNVGTLTQETDGADWRSALILYQNLAGSSALAYESFVRGTTGAPEPLAEYGVRAIARVPIFRERLFLEPVAGYSWPRTDPLQPREGAVLLGFGIEMPFGKPPDETPTTVH